MCCPILGRGMRTAPQGGVVTEDPDIESQRGTMSALVATHTVSTDTSLPTLFYALGAFQPA